MSRLKILANWMYKKVVGQKERATQTTPGETSGVEGGSYKRMEPALHTEKPKGTVKSPKSTLSDAIATITRDFQEYNGAKDRMNLKKGGLKDNESGFRGDEEEIMKKCEVKITAQLDAKGWTKYFKLPYQNISAAIENDRDLRDMKKEERNNLIKLCKDYCHDFQKFENKLQSEVSKLPEEDNKITAPSFQ